MAGFRLSMSREGSCEPHSALLSRGIGADILIDTRIDSYFIAARPSTQRHLYSIPLPSDSSLASLRSGTEPEEPTLLTDAKESKDGYHTVSFSPFGAFYVLGYEGPNIPWQVMKKVGDASKLTFRLVSLSGILELIGLDSQSMITSLRIIRRSQRRRASFRKLRSPTVPSGLLELVSAAYP